MAGALPVLLVVLSLPAAGGEGVGSLIGPPTLDRFSEVEAARAEGKAALGRGDFSLARDRFEAALALAPEDPDALREAGRAAQALGDFIYAAGALGRADELAGHRPDPELHYLRGEALFALGRNAEAAEEHDRADTQLGGRSWTGAEARLARLWEARIEARRGHLDAADRLYRSLQGGEAAPDAEAALAQAEAHALWKDWAGMERVLQAFLAQEPGHERARQMLAWSLEAQGKIEAEVAVRTGLAARGDPAAQRDLARALERARDYPRALGAYQAASQGGADPSLVDAMERIRSRIAPELAVATIARADSAGTSLRTQLGGARPFGGDDRVTVMLVHEDCRSLGPSSADALEGNVRLAGSLWTFTGGATVYRLDAPGKEAELGAGALAATRLQLNPQVLADARLDLNARWSEAPLALAQQGRYSGAEVHFFATPAGDRLVLDVGTQLRTLSLASPGEASPPQAGQALLWAGADLVATVDHTRQLRGQMLDDDLLLPRHLADAIVLGYRHYELFSSMEPAFSSRVRLATRASIEQGIVTVRKIGFSGSLALEARGGLGYDSARALLLSSAGASVLWSLSARSRIVSSFDYARQSNLGLTGTRIWGSLSYHVDL